MINYNYLSCTDYDGKTKEINFCSDTLPETASEDFKLLVAHADTENPNLLHVRESNDYLDKTQIGELYVSKEALRKSHYTKDEINQTFLKKGLTEFYENTIYMRIMHNTGTYIFDGYFKMITKETLQTVLPTPSPGEDYEPTGNEISFDDFLKNYNVTCESYNGTARVSKDDGKIIGRLTAFRYSPSNGALTIKFQDLSAELDIDVNQSYDINLRYAQLSEDSALFLAAYRKITL